MFCQQWELEHLPHCTNVAGTSNSQQDEFCAQSSPTNSTLHTVIVLDATQSAHDRSNGSQPSLLALYACHQDMISVLPSSAQPVIISIPFITQRIKHPSRYGVFGVATKETNTGQTAHRPLNVYVTANGSDWHNRLTWREVANITIPRQCSPLPDTTVSDNTGSATWWFEDLYQAMACVASLSVSGIRPRVTTVPFPATLTTYGLLKTGLTRGGANTKVKENELRLALQNNCSLPATSEASAVAENLLFVHSDVTNFVHIPRLDEHQVNVCVLAILRAGIQVASVPNSFLDLTWQGWLTIQRPEESPSGTKDLFEWTLEETLVYSCLSPHRVLPLWSVGTTQVLAVLGLNVLPFIPPNWLACVPDTWKVSYRSYGDQITYTQTEEDHQVVFAPQTNTPWLRLQGGRIVHYLHSRPFLSPCLVLKHGNNYTFETLLATEIIKSINAEPVHFVVADYLQTPVWGELILCYKCIMSNAQKLLSAPLFNLFSDWWDPAPSSGFMSQNEAAVNVLGEKYYFYGTQTELQTAEYSLPWCAIDIPWSDNTTSPISRISPNQHKLNVELLAQSKLRTQQAIMPCYRAEQLTIGRLYSPTTNENNEHTELSKNTQTDENKDDFPLLYVLLIISVALVVIALLIVVLVRKDCKKHSSTAINQEIDTVRPRSSSKSEFFSISSQDGGNEHALFTNEGYKPIEVEKKFSATETEDSKHTEHDEQNQESLERL
jgi:hypothetical protein